MKNDIKKDLDLFNLLINDFLDEEKKMPVSETVAPELMHKAIDLSLEYESLSDIEFKKSIREILLKSPKSSSSLFFNQLYGGRHSKAVLGDLLASFINNSMATYKIAGVQVGIEKEIIRNICETIGYNNSFGGTFPTGGSMSNFMSLIMARDKVDKKIKDHGLTENLIAYTSENTHYSVYKNASFAGIGKKNVRVVPANNKGQMCVKALKILIEKDLDSGLTPFYLNATAGTTVLCAFDNVEDIAKICKKNNIWLHLDGAFGGVVIFSKKYKKLISGIEKTDSFCFNAHKTLGAPLSTSILVVSQKKHLYNSFSNEASYLYQTHDNDYNLGQTSFECGRRNNALKFWTLWKSIGTKGLEKIVNHEFDLAKYAYDYVSSNTDYNLYSFDSSLSICFNYKDYDPVDLCSLLYKNSVLMVGYGKFREQKFIRLVTINAQNTIKEIKHFFKILEDFCKKNKHKIKRKK
mgnify:FL=1